MGSEKPNFRRLAPLFFIPTSKCEGVFLGNHDDGRAARRDLGGMVEGLFSAGEPFLELHRPVFGGATRQLGRECSRLLRKLLSKARCGASRTRTPMLRGLRIYRLSHDHPVMRCLGAHAKAIKRWDDFVRQTPVFVELAGARVHALCVVSQVGRTNDMPK